MSHRQSALILVAANGNPCDRIALVRPRLFTQTQDEELVVIQKRITEAFFLVMGWFRDHSMKNSGLGVDSHEMIRWFDALILGGQSMIKSHVPEHEGLRNVLLRYETEFSSLRGLGKDDEAFENLSRLKYSCHKMVEQRREAVRR